MSAHYLDYGHRFDGVYRAVADYLLNGGCHVLRRRAEAGCVVGDRQVVVDGLGYADDPHLRASADKEGGELDDGVHGVVTANVEKGLYPVLFKASEYFFVDLGVVLLRGELVAAGAQHR